MYILMWRDIPVIAFNPEKRTGEIIHDSLIRFDKCDGSVTPYEIIENFCASRILFMNRKYSKDILLACGIDDQSPINICIVGKGLSFRDNYWIKEENSTDTWSSVNLYNNEFSHLISRVALTGDRVQVELNDNLYTGELSNLGTRTKCIIRYKNNIILAKEETSKEIAAEVLSSILCEKLGILSTKYIKTTVFDRQCSVCTIATSENIEMLHYRNLLHSQRSRMDFNSESYKFLMDKDYRNFIKMHIFDYITLNTDRNRDNFALQYINGTLVGQYPLYDHDSCFKGLSTDATYFVTNLSFRESIKMLKENYTKRYRDVINSMQNSYMCFLKESKDLFHDAGLDCDYEGFSYRLKECFEIGRTSIFSAVEFK